MKILSFGDLHLHSWPRFSRRLPDGMESRTADGLSVLRQIREYADQHKPDVVLNLGDTTQRQHAIRFKLYNPLVDLLADIAERRHLVIDLGNHDMESATVHSMHPFSKIPNVTIVDAGPSFIRPFEIQVVPYHDDPAQVTAWVDGLPGGRILVAHYGAEGAPLETDYWLDSPLKLTALRRFPLIVFGHIHKPSAQCAHCGVPLGLPHELAGPCVNCHETSGRVIYQGAPMHFDFGDAGNRSVLLIDTDTGERTRLPIKAPKFVTAPWPRVPVQAEEGYLRILNVPRGEIEKVKATFLDAGWLDVVPVPAELDARVKQVAVQGLAIRETTVLDFVEAQAGLSADQREVLIESGQRWLGEARR